MDILPPLRVMLANLQPGQHIDHIIFPNGNPLRVQSEIVRVETHCNFGRIWLMSGPLNWQKLTFKYQVAIAHIQRKKRTQTTPTITTQRSLHAKRIQATPGDALTCIPCTDPPLANRRRGNAMTTQDVQQIDLALIELSGGTPRRAGYDEQTLTSYVEAWERGVQFPAINLYFDGEKYWLSDGFHRVASRKRANLPGSTIAAIVHQGTRRDAVLASLGANATHGLKRSNADKRRAVMTLLRDAEWCKWTNTALAQACGVDETLVRTIKSELSSSVKPKMDDEALAKKCGVGVDIVSEARNQVESLSEERTARRSGKTYTVNTSKIGSKTSDLSNPITTPVTDKPKTGWDISPQALTTTVKGHKIAVHFERKDDEYFFGFRGPGHTISASGFYNESCNSPKILKQYLNPGVYADFRAEELYSAHQKSLAEDNQLDEQTPDTVNTDDAAMQQSDQKEPSPALEPSPTPAAPRPAQTTALMLSAAVEACLGEFTMPVSLDEPLSVTVYVSPKKAIGVWVTKLLKAYKSGEVTEAIALLTLDHQAFVKFSDYALCPLPDGLVAVYLGKRLDNFVMSFEDLGTVWHRFGWRP